MVSGVEGGEGMSVGTWQRQSALDEVLVTSISILSIIFLTHYCLENISCHEWKIILVGVVSESNGGCQLGFSSSTSGTATTSTSSTTTDTIIAVSF